MSYLAMLGKNTNTASLCEKYGLEGQTWYSTESLEHALSCKYNTSVFDVQNELTNLLHAIKSPQVHNHNFTHFIN